MFGRNRPQPESAQNFHASTPPDPSASPAITTHKGKEPIIIKPAPKPLETLDSIVAFLRKYLVCDEHQLTILALWIFHTWCYDLFTTTAYLHVRSPQPESGKTRCLELLGVLSKAGWFASGPPPATIIDLLLDRRSIAEMNEHKNHNPLTLLLDDSHHTLGPSERQQLLAMLNSGVRKMSWYMLGSVPYSMYCPKAFAGNSPLPRSFAARCIPIILKRKKPSDVVARFGVEGMNEAAALIQRLESIDKDRAWIKAKINEGPPQLPTRVLTAHEQDCAEPLLYIADAIGGPWPKKARDAVVACSKLIETTPAIQLLSDIRLSFFTNKDPEYLCSRDLLPALGSMDHRPWAGWTRNSGRRLGRLLRDFGIKSRNFTVESEKLKGYLFKDFNDAWERYIQPLPSAQDVTEHDPAGSSDGPVGMAQ